VTCKYEQHTCTNYEDHNGLQYHSVGSYQHTVAGREATTAHALSYYRQTDVTGMGYNGTANMDPAGNTDDLHNYGSVCDDTSIRAYHKRGERTYNGNTEGHHCKLKDGECKCRCHSLFRGSFSRAEGEAEYNPRSGKDVTTGQVFSNSKWDFNLPVQQDADSQPWVSPTDFSTFGYDGLRPAGRIAGAEYDCDPRTPYNSSTKRLHPAPIVPMQARQASCRPTNA